MIFCNRTLNLKKISHIGLDMDHTLVTYHSERFEALAYENMKAKLVENFGYPEEVLKLKFDFKRAIRGLVIDRNQGNLLKVSRYGAVKQAYHGLEKVDFRKHKRLFGTRFIDLGDPSFDCVDTTFSISHACLYAQVVDLKDSNPSYEIPDYVTLANQLNQALDLSHRDGSIKNVVVADPEKYVKRSESIVRGIQKFKKYDKTFFLVTNSDYLYTNEILKYAIDPYLDGEKWSEFFDYSFTLSMKPRFFYSSLPLLKIDTETSRMENWDKEIVKGVYQGGSASLLSTAWDLVGDQILYVGDHIYGDILRLKKDCAWRTGLIIEELGEEIAQNQRAMNFTTDIRILMDQKMELERYLNDLVAERLERQVPEEDKEQKVRDQISALDEKIKPLLEKRIGLYNPHWGPVMRTGVEESQFANQVERFSDIYMPSLEDLLMVSPRHYFRSFIRKMAHD